MVVANIRWAGAIAVWLAVGLLRERVMTTGFTRPRPETGFLMEIPGLGQIFGLKNPVSRYLCVYNGSQA